MDNSLFLGLLFIALLVFVYFYSALHFKVVKFLVEKLVQIKTFSAGMPIQTEPDPMGRVYVPRFDDDDFGAGKVVEKEEEELPLQGFDEELKVGDELKGVGL